MDKDDEIADNREALRAALEAGVEQEVRRLLEILHPAEIADVLEALTWDLRPALWRDVPIAAKGEVLLETYGEVRAQLIDVSEDQELLTALAGLEMDELADLDADLPVSVLDAMVQAMDVQTRDRYEAVRSYSDDTAGGLMDVDAAAVRSDVTLKAVLRYLQQVRAREGQLPEHLDSLMVVNRKGTYLGVLKLSDVVSLKSKTTVVEAMWADAPAVPVATPASKVARLFQDKDLISAAVVSDEGRLLGRIPSTTWWT